VVADTAGAVDQQTRNLRASIEARDAGAIRAIWEYPLFSVPDTFLVVRHPRDDEARKNWRALRAKGRSGRQTVQLLSMGVEIAIGIANGIRNCVANLDKPKFRKLHSSDIIVRLSLCKLR
jgi:hypothetical protein